MINGSTDKCYKCGSTEHFANSCKVSIKLKCGRCNRNGHTVDNCYATTFNDGIEANFIKSSN